MVYDPEVVNQLSTLIDQLPGNIREQVVQNAIQEAGHAKSLSWMQYISELHTIYLTRLESEKEQGKQRWTWLKVVLEQESTEGHTTALQIIMEALAKQEGKSGQETCAAIETPVDAIALEAYVRKTLALGVLTSTALPQILTTPEQIMIHIEQERQFPSGYIIDEIINKKILHLHIRVQRDDVEGLCKQVQTLLGKGTLLVLEVPGQPDNERTIYYQQKLSGMPRNKDEEITDAQLMGILQSLGLDKRSLAIQHIINQSESIFML